MIYRHFSDFKDWDKERWPNFKAEELSCSHCGEYYHWPEFLDRLQHVRTLLGEPVRLNSAHRCRLHNARVGGAPLSQHKKLAVDISIRGKDPKKVLKAAIEAGFRGYGFYNTFLHVDLGRLRSWPRIEKRNPQWL